MMMKTKLSLFLALTLILSAFSGVVGLADTSTVYISEDFESWNKSDNPLTNVSEYGKWYSASENTESGKRGSVIAVRSDTNTKVLNFWYQKNSTDTTKNVERVQMSRWLVSDHSPLNRNDGTFTMKTQFYVPSQSGYSIGINYNRYAKFLLTDGQNDIELLSVQRVDSTLSIVSAGQSVNIAQNTWHDLTLELSATEGKHYITVYLNGNETAVIDKKTFSVDNLRDMKEFKIDVNCESTDNLNFGMVLQLEQISFSHQDTIVPSFSYTSQFKQNSINGDGTIRLSTNLSLAAITADDIQLTPSATISNVTMQDDGKGFDIVIAGLQDRTQYKAVMTGFTADDNALCTMTVPFTYNGKYLMYAGDNFENYGTNGMDSNGKYINPLTTNTSYGNWYSSDGASKRGVVIATDIAGTSPYYVNFWKQPNVNNTRMAMPLKEDGSALSDNYSVTLLKTKFLVPYASNAIGVHENRYVQYMFSQTNTKDGVELIRISPNGSTPAISFAGVDSKANINENEWYEAYLELYTAGAGYLANAYLIDKSGNRIDVLKSQNVALSALPDSKYLMIYANCESTGNSSQVFRMDGVEAMQMTAPKMQSNSIESIHHAVPIETSEIEVEFNADIEKLDNSGFSINNSAVIESVTRLSESTIKIAVSNLGFYKQYILSLGGVQNALGYGCVDQIVFKVEKNIGIKSYVVNQGAGPGQGDNVITIVAEKSKADYKFLAIAVLCKKTSGTNYVIEDVDSVEFDSKTAFTGGKTSVDFSLSLNADATDNREIRLYIWDDASNMFVLEAYKTFAF